MQLAGVPSSIRFMFAVCDVTLRSFGQLIQEIETEKDGNATSVRSRQIDGSALGIEHR